ncbi:ABC transporter permease [Roseospirillum parvum]|uniref:Polar amino acid transport system permease protein n=1 Tax=Roseospirillum parvum TaxID=83401 RepID=A0A1G7TKB3_9PROT|nr:ABC transporter permease [Roseospirillum parvum]SDG35766.1 polar amino acid transport system permease protein [Roseospirillum parvum]
MPDFQGFENQLLAGTWMTLRLAFATLPLGIALGLMGAAARLSRLKVLRGLGTAYVEVFRGLPELLVVLTIYFGASVVLMGLAKRLFDYDGYIELSPFIAGTLALALTFGAYATEVFRGAFQAIPKGQAEAALALGMSRGQVFRRVTLPQTWRLALPGLGNLFLIMMKDTALVSVIGLEELMRKTQFAVGQTKEPFTFYLSAALIYLTLTVVAMALLHLMERRANRGLLPRRAG